VLKEVACECLFWWQSIFCGTGSAKMYSLYQRPAECSFRHRVVTLQLFICTLQKLSTQLTTYVSGPIDNRRWRGLSIPQRFGCQGRPWLRHAHVGGRRKGTLILHISVWGLVTPHFSVCDDARGVAWPLPHLVARMQNVQLALAASRVLHSRTWSRLSPNKSSEAVLSVARAVLPLPSG